MKTRAIPTLPAVDDDTTTYKTRLQRVTAIVRHGARTPIHSKNCWKGHWDEPDGIWDCGLKTLLSTRPYYEGQNDPENDRGQFFVEKIYDAFLGEKYPSPYRNAMNGTCQDGQLIQQGYDQQIENGKHLRKAYVYDDLGDENGEDDGDPRLRLFTTSVLSDAGSENDRFLDGFIRLRSDDDQRTLASGQVLLSSMFGPEAAACRRERDGAAPVLAHHTADRNVDIVSSWQRTWRCPQQKEVIQRALASEAYQAFYHSDESHKIRQLIDDELEPEGVQFGGLDCMITSMCTDRGIPDVINDYRKPVDENDPYTKKYGPNRFERLRDYVRIELLLRGHEYFACFVGIDDRMDCVFSGVVLIPSVSSLVCRFVGSKPRPQPNSSPGRSKHDLHQPVQRLGTLQDGHGTTVGRNHGIEGELCPIFGPRLDHLPAHVISRRKGLERDGLSTIRQHDADRGKPFNRCIFSS